mgnify:CR=1 FL=1
MSHRYRISFTMYVDEKADWFTWSPDFETKEEAEAYLTLCRAAPKLLEAAKEAIESCVTADFVTMAVAFNNLQSAIAEADKSYPHAKRDVLTEAITFAEKGKQ